jgi:hypothetical protein
VRSTEWESFKRNVQFAEKSSQPWTAKINIAVPVALKKPVRNNKAVSKKIQRALDKRSPEGIRQCTYDCAIIN